MRVLLTGGAGFIGRWVAKKLIEMGNDVWILDNLSNGRVENLEEFKESKQLKAFINGDIKDNDLLSTLFENKIDICYHLGASINVQDSIDDPETTFNNDVIGTFNVLELCRKYHTRMVFMSTCMVYDRANNENGIIESHPLKPASPYAGAKISGENLVLSYWYAYKLPVTILRPFNTYGPFQKSGGEGGVVAIFCKRALGGKDLNIYGEGKQTRDLLYVEDCARFVIEAGLNDMAIGETINAGTGYDISINELAMRICGDSSKIKHVEHIHPQSEIQKLLCNYSKASKILSWRPEISLDEGIARTMKWISENPSLV
ncbi:MAG: SDR family NAD(P)-dependent oxidoreductase [Clostridia bacterium]|nr:SDR family NAD(P)-dependent oxidoreductase [Clostridia bacterium]